MVLRSSGAVLALVLLSMAGTATAQNPGAHAEAYRACPAGGVAFWMGATRRAPSPPDRPDAVVLESFGVDVRWAGDEDWIEPKPVPDDVLESRRTWVRPSGMIDRHRAIRRDSDRGLPQGSPRILLAERTEHWAWRWESTVAVRGEDGVWSVDYIKRYDDGSTEVDQRIMDAAASRRMDELIADPCLAREPFQSDWTHIQSSDNTRWTLEVETAASTTRIAGRDTGFGRAGAINHLLHGGGAE